MVNLLTFFHLAAIIRAFDYVNFAQGVLHVKARVSRFLFSRSRSRSLLQLELNASPVAIVHRAAQS